MLTDKFNRKIDYLRISVTDRCNLRCIYCVPSLGFIQKKHDEILRFEEILKLLTVFVSLGIKKIKITGGEPLFRKGIIDFIAKVFNINAIKDVSITTNGILLKDYAYALRKTGLRRLNISIDTLDKDKFRYITGADKLREVLDGLNEVRKLKFSPVKINTVVIRGINDDEILDFARLSIENPYEIRFIEYMPTQNSIGWDKDKFISSAEIKAKLMVFGKLYKTDHITGAGHAQYFKFQGALGTIGVISPVSNSFCSKCNKLRLTADGKLKLCLHSSKQVDLKTPLRANASFNELKDMIISGINLKPEGNYLEKHSFPEYSKNIMCQIGG